MRDTLNSGGNSDLSGNMPRETFSQQVQQNCLQKISIFLYDSHGWASYQDKFNSGIKKNFF